MKKQIRKMKVRNVNNKTNHAFVVMQIRGVFCHIIPFLHVKKVMISSSFSGIESYQLKMHNNVSSYCLQVCHHCLSKIIRVRRDGKKG